MESGTFYVCRNINNRSSPRTQSRSQDAGKDRKQRGRRCLVLMTVCLGIICVLLLIFIILQFIIITAERDLVKSYKNTVEEFNQTINNLQNKYTDLMTEKPELETRVKDLTAEKNQIQNNLEQKLELESEVTSLSEELKEISKQGNLCGAEGLFISSEEKSWSDSRQFCRDRGADLVIINTEEKQRFISSFIKERVWIGLTDIENEGNMTWVDDSPLNRGFWYKDEPNNADGDEDCVEMLPSLNIQNWNDLQCSQNRKGICEK